MKVLNEYPNSHHYIEEFNKTNIFCPSCATQNVWEANEGDYYAGPEYLCTECSVSFNMPSGPNPVSEKNVLGKIEQLKSQQTKAPSTKRGG